MTGTVAYAYDPSNRLIGRVHDATPAVAGDEHRTAYVHDLGQTVLQFEGSGPAPLTAGDLAHRYLWGPGYDRLIADERVDWSDGDADGPVYWALADHLGTVRDLVDAAGVVVSHASYNAFGAATEATGSVATTDFGYTGKLFDATTGLQNNWHRWYDATTGRWISEDPIKDGLNWNAYVGNGPTGYVDPDGLAKKKRPAKASDLSATRQFDMNLAQFVLDIINDMQNEKWTPSNPRNDGAFGVEFERRIFERIEECADDFDKNIYTDIVIDNETLEVMSIGEGAGSKRTTQLDILLYDGDLEVGDTVDQKKILGNYEIKAGTVIDDRQLVRQARLTGRQSKLVIPPKRYIKKGWYTDLKLQKRMDFLGKIGGGLAILAIACNQVDAAEIDHLIRERERVKNPTEFQVWAYGDLHTFLLDLGVDAVSAKGIEWYLIDQYEKR